MLVRLGEKWQNLEEKWRNVEEKNPIQNDNILQNAHKSITSIILIAISFFIFFTLDKRFIKNT